jgi:hypothetical protein
MTPPEQPVVILACKVFKTLLEERLPGGLASRVEFFDYGLHRIPVRLRVTVQDMLDSIEQPSLVVLGYGLCGNGLNNIQAGPHTLLIPRADDCIAILLGSYKRYMHEFESEPGTYYLTKGWLESGSDPLKEYTECVEKYGPEEAQWIMDMQYQNYRRLVFVAHSDEDLEAYRPRALEVAEYCKRWGMVYEEVLGSDVYVRRLVELAADVDKHADPDFVVVPPGGELKQSQFIR